MKISAVYKITNTMTGDFYIGSSKNVKRRWASHKCQSTWKKYPNKQLYQDMKKYGIDSFELELLEEVEADSLREKEQQFIEKLQPTYNNRNADGWNFERLKQYQREYQKTDKYKSYQIEYQKEYENQFCYYNGETLTLHALYQRFRKAGIEHPTAEAKRYLIRSISDDYKDIIKKY